jgi:hypothetical protein
MATPDQLDQQERDEREAAKLRRRYPSHHQPDPKPVEIPADATPEERRKRKRYPSHYRDRKHGR